MIILNVLVINCSPVKTGATAAIVHLVTEQLSAHYPTKSICIDDYTFRFCQGCRTCHHTAKCVIEDDVTAIMDEWEQADIIISVAPSYWAELPGQFKAFIDRCTPWCDTHEPHASLRKGKKGYAIVLRTGSGMKECDRLVQSLEHFYGHLAIECSGHLRLCSVAGKEDVPAREEELIAFCRRILSK